MGMLNLSFADYVKIWYPNITIHLPADNLSPCCFLFIQYVLRDSLSCRNQFLNDVKVLNLIFKFPADEIIHKLNAIGML